MFLTPLARLRLAGRLCRMSTWLILAIRCVVCICLFFALYSPDTSNTNSTQLLALLALLGIVVIFVFFVSLFLFALGTLLEYLAAADSNGKSTSQRELGAQESSDEHVEITSLPH